MWYFWQQNIDLIFCTSCKILGRFFDTKNINSIFVWVAKYRVDKYRADIYNSLVNQTLWLQGAYRLEIISARSGRSGQLPIQILFWGIDRFCRLLIGVKPISEMCQYNRNHDSKHALLLAFTFIHLTLIKALFLHLKSWFDTNQQSTKSIKSLKQNLYRQTLSDGVLIISYQ